MRKFWNKWIATPLQDRHTSVRRRPRRRLGMEVLEDRAVPAGIGWDYPSGVITVEGTSSLFGDKVQISYSDIDYVKVTLSQFHYDFATMTGSWVQLDEKMFVNDAVQKVVYHGHEGSDKFFNSTSVASYANGGDGNDTLEGGSGTDTLVGHAGADTLKGNGGNDTLWGYGLFRAGADGDNTIYGGWGDDTIYGGSTNELIFGDSGNDQIYAGSGDDKVYGGSGADELYGEGGNDKLSGDGDNDKLVGGEGADILHGGFYDLGMAGDSAADGDDIVEGGDGVDKLSGGGGTDALHGGSGVDFLFGGDGTDYLYGNEDIDSLFGGSGGDYLYGGGGDDALHGDAGVDTLNGGDDDDTLHGGSDNDFLHGGEDNDRLFGNSGTDWLFGDGGNDWLEAGSAAESAFGGTGTDFNAHVWAINGTQRDDIDQGAAPTCWLMAPLSSVAGTGVDLSSRIQYLGNSVYRVELLVNVGGSVVSTFEDVAFDGTVLSQDARPLSQGANGLEESWVLLFQRAWLQRIGVDWSDASAIGGGTSTGILEALTGRVTSWYGAGFLSGLSSLDRANIQLALLAGKNVVAATWDPDVKWLSTDLLIGWHAYVVVAVNFNSSTSSWEVLLRNPHATDGGNPVGDASDGYVTVSWNDFSKSMAGYYIN